MGNGAAFQVGLTLLWNLISHLQIQATIMRTITEMERSREDDEGWDRYEII
jgi:hypothetical protein